MPFTHTNLSLPTRVCQLIRHEKRSFLKTLFKPEEFENTSFSFSCGQNTNNDNIYLRCSVKTARFDNGRVTTMWLPWPSFLQTHIQSDRCSFFLNSSDVVSMETIDAFSEWNLRFQIPPALCGRGLSCKVVIKYCCMSHDVVIWDVNRYSLCYDEQKQSFSWHKL